MSAITHSAIAPNGATVKVHKNFESRASTPGFVYVKGHRVYGRYIRTYTTSEGFRSTFTPEGKWSYLLQPNTSAPQQNLEQLASV